MAYRDVGGGGYGQAGYHSDLPLNQITNLIDPDEFPFVAGLLQNTHLSSHAGSTTGSSGYPEEGARHLRVYRDGSRYITTEGPGQTAPYSGFGYITAPESNPGPPHAFGGIIRNPAEVGYHGRETYPPAADGYANIDAEKDYRDGRSRTRNRSNSYYNYPSGEYLVPAGTVPPRASTKTPSHGEGGPPRRSAATSVHQSRPPNSRHSSSENGDPYEQQYLGAGRHDKADYNQVRPKTAKPRPNSFSYSRNDPRPIDSEPAFTRYDNRRSGEVIPPSDPRSSTGSLGNPNLRYGASPVIHQGGEHQYYRDGYTDNSPGAMIHSPGARQGRTYNRDTLHSQPLGGHSYYPADDRGDFEERRYRNRSKSRYRAKTPGPEERQVSEDERGYGRYSGGRTGSPDAHGRAKSRVRGGSTSPPGYRSKSRMRSRSRPRHAESPSRPTTPGPSRAKTPMPETSAAPRNPMQSPEDVIRAREIEREKERSKQEREKDSWDAYSDDARGRNFESDREKRHRHKSRRGDRDSGSASVEGNEREKEEDRERRHRERKKEKEREKEKERDREGGKEKEKEKEKRDRKRESGSAPREETSKPVTDPALSNPMVEDLNPKRERAGVQPGQVFIRPDLLCAMRALKLCIAEEDPSDSHSHNYLLRLDCGHGYHEDCLRSTIASRERTSMAGVDLEADKLWCERCRGMFGKKAGM